MITVIGLLGAAVLTALAIAMSISGMKRHD